MARLQSPLFDADFRARLEEQFWVLAQELLHSGQSVILDFGFWRHAQRDRLRCGARVATVGVELRYLDVPFDELWRRVEQRNLQEDKAMARISEDQLAGWALLFEPPQAAELQLFDRPPD